MRMVLVLLLLVIGSVCVSLSHWGVLGVLLFWLGTTAGLCSPYKLLHFERRTRAVLLATRRPDNMAELGRDEQIEAVFNWFGCEVRWVYWERNLEVHTNYPLV